MERAGLALATSTAFTAATARSSTHPPRRERTRATAVVMTFDPHPPRRSGRKSASAADDDGAEAEALADTGIQGAAVVGSRPSCRVGPGTFRQRVLVDWLRSPKSGRRISSSPRPRRQRHVLARSALQFSGENRSGPLGDFVVSSTRIRRLVAEGRVDETGALLGHQ
jgi:FAD synthase